MAHGNGRTPGRSASTVPVAILSMTPSGSLMALATQSRRSVPPISSVFLLLHSHTSGYVGMEVARRAVDPACYGAFEARRYPTRAAIGAQLGPAASRMAG